jgi:hypothetical protein
VEQGVVVNPVDLVVFALSGDGLKVYVAVMGVLVAVCITLAIREGRHG